MINNCHGSLLVKLEVNVVTRVFRRGVSLRIAKTILASEEASYRDYSAHVIDHGLTNDVDGAAYF
jgi:hypothetical protein